MAYEYITKYDSPNYGYPTGTKGQNKPTKIIIHHWGADGMSFDGVVSWLCNPKSYVSAHYVIEAGKAACLVNWNDAAWHAGSRTANTSSIGLECRPEMSDGDFDTVAQVIASIWKGLGKKVPLYGHKDYANTSCPGRYYPKLKQLYALAEKYYNGETPKPQPTPTTKLKVNGDFDEKSVARLQEFLGSYVDGFISGQLKSQAKYFTGLTSVEFGGGGSICIERLQILVGLKGDDVDGLLGRITVTAVQKFLIKNGYDCGEWGADGYWGEATSKALQRFLNDQK